MICKKCGKDFVDSSKFCPYCGTPNNLRNEPQAPQQPEYIPPVSYQQPAREQPVYPQTPAPVAPQAEVQSNPYDIPSILLSIFSFFDPFLGLVLFLSWNKEYPKRAKSVGIAALVGFILKFIVAIIVGILSTTVFAAFFTEIIEEIMWYF